MEIKAGDYMGIMEKDIVVSTSDMSVATKRLIDLIVKEDSEIVTLIYGEGVDEAQANEIAAYIEDKHDIEVEMNCGNQPVYSYIIGVE